MPQKLTVHTSGHIIIENDGMDLGRLNGSFSFSADHVCCVSPFQYQGDGTGVRVFVIGSDEPFDIQLPLITVLNAIADARRMVAIDLKHI